MKRILLALMLLSSISYGQALNNTYTKFPNGFAVGDGATNKPTSSPSTGSLWYKTGTGFQVYNGATWVTLGEAGSGVTSFTGGFGLTPTSLQTGAVTVRVDSTQVQTVANFFPKGDTRWARTGFTGTVTSVGLTAGTGISIGGTSPITSSGSFSVTNTAPDQTVVLTDGTGIDVTGTYPNFTITNTSPNTGTTTNSLSTGYGLSGSSFDGSVARTFTADTTSATGLVSKSRLATNLTGYVPVTRTVAGFALSSNVTLASLSAGNGINLTSYDGSTARTASVDTTVIGSKAWSNARFQVLGTAPTLSVSTVSTGGYANGLNYASGVFRLGKVSATNPGVLTTGTDTIAGEKTFIGSGSVVALNISGGSNSTQLKITKPTTVASGVVAFLTDPSTVDWTIRNAGTTSDFEIYNFNTKTFGVSKSTNAITMPSSGGLTVTGPTTLSSLTTGPVYSSSGTLTNTAPTSGTIGYWSRTGTTLTTATGTDAVTLGGALTGTSATFSSATLSTFWDGSQGVKLGAYTGGLGVGAIYATAVTPSNSNYIVAGNSTSSYFGGGSITANNSTNAVTLAGALTGTTATFTRNTVDAVSAGFINTSSTGYGVKIQGGVGSRYALQVSDYLDNSLLNISPGTGATFSGNISATSYTGALNTAVTAVTQSANDNSTKVATTAYADGAGNVVNLTTSALSNATLSSTYPSVAIGYRVICPDITGAPAIYTKAKEGGATDTWLTTATILTP